MQQPKPIPGRIAPGTREVLIDYLKRHGSPDAVICLLKVTMDVETEEKWIFGHYEPENIKSLEPQLAREGQCLLYELDSMIVAIPQFDRLDEIIGKEVGLRSEKLVFQDYTD